MAENDASSASVSVSSPLLRAGSRARYELKQLVDLVVRDEDHEFVALEHERRPYNRSRHVLEHGHLEGKLPRVVSRDVAQRPGVRLADSLGVQRVHKLGKVADLAEDVECALRLRVPARRGERLRSGARRCEPKRVGGSLRADERDPSGHEDVERGQRNAVASQAQRVRQADEVVLARERILEPRSRGAVDGGGVARPAEDIIPFEGEGREEQLRNERLELLVVHVFRKRRARQEAGLEHEARGDQLATTTVASPFRWEESKVTEMRSSSTSARTHFCSVCSTSGT